MLISTFLCHRTVVIQSSVSTFAYIWVVEFTVNNCIQSKSDKTNKGFLLALHISQIHAHFFSSWALRFLFKKIHIKIRLRIFFIVWIYYLEYKFLKFFVSIYFVLSCQLCPYCCVVSVKVHSEWCNSKQDFIILTCT